MDFLEPYVLALQERAPDLYRTLWASGSLESHLQSKVAEAQKLYEWLTADAPRLPNGVVRQPWAQEAGERVRAALICFPTD